MLVIFIIFSYICISLIYRSSHLNHIFVLKTLKLLKTNKYRDKIARKIIIYEKRINWFIFWPILEVYEWYENWQENRDRNIKS